MRLLLDTHVLLWWLGALPRLGVSARDAIATADKVLVSAVSGYEIGFKRFLGKLDVPDDLESQLERHGFDRLPVTLRHAARAADLAVHHRDPFDRILVAQARCEGLTLVTTDRKISVYDVPILPAGR